MSSRRDGLVAGGRRLAVGSTERTSVRVSDWAVSVTGFLLLGGAGIVLELHGRRSGSAVTAAQALAAGMRSTPGRIADLAWWLWLGCISWPVEVSGGTN
jgi:hypothetical protein